MEILTINNIKVCVVPRVNSTDEELATAIKTASEALGGEKVILVRTDVAMLDANTILDHNKNYYFAQYE